MSIPLTGALQDVLATLWTQEDQPLIGLTLPVTAGDVLADPCYFIYILCENFPTKNQKIKKVEPQFLRRPLIDCVYVNV